MTLCQTFRTLAFQTWDMLAQGRAYHTQIGEETFTDLNTLALRTRHSSEVKTQTFSKPEERHKGGDLELWFHGRNGFWFGIRLQAKVIEVATNRFRHLHYKPRGSREFQSDILIRSCFEGDDEPKPVPLYCLYAHWPHSPNQTFIRNGHASKRRRGK